MKLSKAVSLQVEYGTILGAVRVDADGFICLNDMEKYFPGKRLQHWMDNESTKSFIDCLQRIESQGFQNNRKEGEFESVESQEFQAIRAKRGKSGGTWAHKDLAFEFCMWLSPEFKLHVIRAYQQGTQKKEDWNIKRVMAAANFKLMTDNLKSAREEEGKETKFYHYSNEALMLNEIVFGVREGEVRNSASEAELEALSALEGHNATLLGLGWEYSQRKDALRDLFNKLVKPKMIAYKSEI